MVHLTFVNITLSAVTAVMARNIAALLLAVGLASCMEMRETVERMVMVRTTGSDLQPAATGYIYKKESNGPASVIEMGESEVMEELSKLYKKPESYAAPGPAAPGPFYEKQEDEDHAASHAKERIIPVVEKAEKDDSHDGVDGLADDGFPKYFKEYASDFGDYNSDFADYLHGLGHFDHGIYHGFGEEEGKKYGAKGYDDNGDKGYKGYASKHHYGKGGAGDYHTEKYESYSTSGEGGTKKSYGGAGAYGKNYAEGKEHKGGDEGHKKGHSKGEAIDGYHKVYNKNEYKKDHGVYDGEKVSGGYGKHADGNSHHGSDAGDFEESDSHESGHDQGDFGKGGFHERKHGGDHDEEHSSDEGAKSYHSKGASFGADGGKLGGKGFGFKVKH